eukprot:GEMP01062488.1.p2 GENE.GEMP01062488.1~~GEMP01062488.1.p2  ORF type:complete len:103 (+),score=28.18 GEMP01062488.1:499-807(+)
MHACISTHACILAWPRAPARPQARICCAGGVPRGAVGDLGMLPGAGVAGRTEAGLALYASGAQLWVSVRVYTYVRTPGRKRPHACSGARQQPPPPTPLNGRA